MTELMKNLIAAKDGGGWEQLIILAVVFGFAILKKIFSVMKEHAERQTEQQRPLQQHKPRPSQPASARKKYANSEFKTIEQLRQEKIAQIRAAYGIPKPVKLTHENVREESQRDEMRREESRQTEFRREEERPEEPWKIEQKQMEPPPIYVPKKKKKSVQTQTAYRPEYSRQEIAPLFQEVKTKAAPETKEQRHRLVNLSSVEDLRSAILYQEILGKPLALRD
ncbi:MAG: hypothetical protein A2Y10_02195 [Planctomycetes bacterium GWF2_41_51]|nr:MAG: hypothetical protein A2Y10_02195 [Planctomycetes bacterium GWF2_41_51]HBG25781.1 hypothetical protein [Phycisphaerales bacterium]